MITFPFQSLIYFLIKLVFKLKSLKIHIGSQIIKETFVFLPKIE